MTLSNSGSDLAVATDIFGVSNSSWDVLYCPHLWNNSELRNAFLNPPQRGNTKITYCYTCRGKIRKYELRPSRQEFAPNDHSTPNGKIISSNIDANSNIPLEVSSSDTSPPGLPLGRTSIIDPNTTESNVIPSISQQIDASYRQKFSSFEPRARTSSVGHRRLRKSLKGIGCVVSLALADSSVKKRTQIQACSISVMIVAILVISFVLVNFTNPNFNNLVSTKAVPTQISDSNETSFAMTSLVPNALHPITDNDNLVEMPTTYEYPDDFITEGSSPVPDFIAKIRKNLLTYLKDTKKKRPSDVSYDKKPKDINNRDLSFKFCSCQSHEVCMLDENSGTAVCRKASDIEDPTGCGGLCALYTEACQLVDRARGVRVCRLLSPVTCSPHEWRCRNGLCVDAKARCDGIIQCYDRSDETYCECDLAKQFRCGHAISCFPNSKICDGVIDCWDGLDEVNCTAACPEDQFTCTDGQCILQSRFCDGLADCADGSDEPRGCDGGCGSGELRCRNGRCVPLSARCDGRDQCGDASDELNCPVTSTTPKINRTFVPL